MSKKLIIGFVLAIVIALPATSYAWSLKQQASPLFGTRCERDPDSSRNSCDVIVDKYRDSQISCYVARTDVGSGNLPDIALSCVRND